MEFNPKTSVVLACRDQERFIAEAVDSILTQSQQDLELIIVDDGSTDLTLKKIYEYDDPRIVVVEESNAGFGSALNRGIARSQGQYIGFLKGSDVSLPNRLLTQIEQIEKQNADIVFCLPQIIGVDSKPLDNSSWSLFFHRDFRNTSDLFRLLFYHGNFLCTSSFFCRRTALEKVGQFKRGLAELQDFDYLVRACKKELVIKLYDEPVIQFRHVTGATLSLDWNDSRARIEARGVYTTFFDNVPKELLLEAFGVKMTSRTRDGDLDMEIDKSFLFLGHGAQTVQEIGIERLIAQMDDDKIHGKLVAERDFDTVKFLRLPKTSKPVDSNVDRNRTRVLRPLRSLLKLLVLFALPARPVPGRVKVEKEIQYFLDKGDQRRALLLAHGFRKALAGPIIITRAVRLIDKILSKTRKLLLRVTKELAPPPVLDGVFPLKRMYDFSRAKNHIVCEQPLERVYLHKPKVVGTFQGALHEGEVSCPRAYVSLLSNVVVTGGSSLVISQTGDILSDEMVDFPSTDLGVKSPFVCFRNDRVAILTYKRAHHARVREGILLSCEHDSNYFHWLIECLPKLLLVDDLKKFNDVPLLLPPGLHENLKAALERVNHHLHPIIHLDRGVAYHVERLIFPSALSVVVDRYVGRAVFDSDIVFSEEWISRVINALKSPAQHHKKPWRKVYVERKERVRSVNNQTDIVLALQKNKFEIVEIDNMSFASQVDLFSEVSILVAPTGAAVTNMLFCQPGTKVIVFMSNHESTNFYFWSHLGSIAKVDVHIILGQRLFNLRDQYSVHDDYVIDTKTLLDEIDHFTN